MQGFTDDKFTGDHLHALQTQSCVHRPGNLPTQENHTKYMEFNKNCLTCEFEKINEKLDRILTSPAFSSPPMILSTVEKVEKPHLCPLCDGIGHKLTDKSIASNCTVCDGKGFIRC